jgi:manganese/zinc/iron transport system substrate-binding protein
MSDLLITIGRDRKVGRITEGIAEDLLREPPEFEGMYDPHIWFDVSLWQKAVEKIQTELCEIDPDHAQEYKTRGEAYRGQLAELHSWVKKEIASIPKEFRVLVTAHDAFGYFGQAYDIEVIGLQGISTASDYGINDVERLVDMLVKRKIRAVFVESSVPQRSIEAVVEGCKARNHQVVIGGSLFSDSMGKSGTPEGTYIGMVRHNVNLIVTALKGGT